MQSTTPPNASFYSPGSHILSALDPLATDPLAVNLPQELDDVLRAELQPGEQVAYAAQPQKRRMVASTLPIVLFGLPWTAFAVFWICGAAGFKLPDFARGGFSFFPLFGLPFVLIGLGMLSAPFWAARLARYTVYAITDQRVLMISGGRTKTIRSLWPHDLQQVYRRERPDGSGDVVLRETVTTTSGDRERTSQHETLMGIPDARHAESLVRKLAEKAVNSSDQ